MTPFEETNVSKALEEAMAIVRINPSEKIVLKFKFGRPDQNTLGEAKNEY
jgi:hypothetical protein